MPTCLSRCSPRSSLIRSPRSSLLAYPQEDLECWRLEDSTSGQTTVTDFTLDGGDGKEMLVEKEACVEWCPTTSTYFNEIKAGNGENGTTVAKNVPLPLPQGQSAWKWSDLLFIIPMDTKTLFVDNESTPLHLEYLITPFGKEIGNSTSVYTAFDKTKVDRSKFKIANTENCPKVNPMYHTVVLLTVYLPWRVISVRTNAEHSDPLY